MSANIAILMIDGDHLAEVGKVYRILGYEQHGTSRILTKWADVEKTIYTTETEVVRKAACYHQGWTIIIDPELTTVLATDKSELEAIHAEFQSRLVGIICEGVSNTYGFLLFDAEARRRVIAGEGTILIDEGQTLPIEATIHWDKVFLEDEMAGILRSVGVEYNSIFSEPEHYVVQGLQFEAPVADPAIAPTKSNGATQNAVRTKPWWRFW